MRKRKLIVDGSEITLAQKDAADFVSLTDMARKFNPVPADIIKAWMRNSANVEFLGTWEIFHNPDFKTVAYNHFKMASTSNAFILTTKQWVEETGAIGIYAEAGRYGGTFAHKDIAIQFATWLSPTFYLFVIHEFQRLKDEETQRLESGWDLRRQLAKLNFQIHAEAVREHLVPVIDWNTRREAIFQASEADLLNLAMFGMTAREWQTTNPELAGNLRDHASAEQLLVLANLESLNSKLISWNLPRDQRLEILNQTAREQMEILGKNASAKLISITQQKGLPNVGEPNVVEVQNLDDVSADVEKNASR